MHIYEHNFRMNDIQRYIKTPRGKGGDKDHRRHHKNKDLQKFKKTVKRLKIETDAFQRFLDML